MNFTAPDPSENFEQDVERIEKQIEASVAIEPLKLEPAKPEQPAGSKAQEITALTDGQIVGKSFEDQFRLARAYCASQLLPASFNTPEKVMLGMQFAYELGLKPLTAMRQMMVVNGTPSLWGDLPLGLCRSSRNLKSIEEKLYDQDGKEICLENGNLGVVADKAVCTTVRTNGETRTTSFTLEEAKRAELYGNPKKPIWKLYPNRMLKMRARGENLKDNFGDVLNGVPIAEYDYGIEGSPGATIEAEFCRPRTRADALNEKLGL